MSLLDHTAPAAIDNAAASGTRVTRALLTCAAAGPPLWAVVALTQAATREGFDISRYPLSALSNGALGWLQITNFVVSGLLIVIGSFGLRRVLRGGVGGTWVPRLVAVSGLAMAAAGVLVMDPMPGFPAGTAASTAMSASSIGHMASGSISFLTTAIACYILGRRFSRAGLRGLAVASRVAGTAVLIGNAGAMSGAPLGTLVMAVGVITGSLWIAAVAARHLRAL